MGGVPEHVLVEGVPPELGLAEAEDVSPGHGLGDSLLLDEGVEDVLAEGVEEWGGQSLDHALIISDGLSADLSVDWVDGVPLAGMLDFTGSANGVGVDGLFIKVDLESVRSERFGPLLHFLFYDRRFGVFNNTGKE